MTLPTRSEANDSLHNWDIEWRAEAVVEAYCNDVLMTREEAFATIDYEAMSRAHYDEWGHRMSVEEAKRLVGVAIREDDTCPIDRPHDCKEPCF